MAALAIRTLAAAAVLALAMPGGSMAQPSPAPASAPPRAARIPVAHFAQVPFMQDPVLSPDGTRIAARITDSGPQRIGV